MLSMFYKYIKNINNHNIKLRIINRDTFLLLNNRMFFNFHSIEKSTFLKNIFHKSYFFIYLQNGTEQYGK